MAISKETKARGRQAQNVRMWLLIPVSLMEAIQAQAQSNFIPHTRWAVELLQRGVEQMHAQSSVELRESDKVGPEHPEEDNKEENNVPKQCVLPRLQARVRG